MLIVFRLVFILVSIDQFAISRNIPSYVNLCKRTDPDLSECFKKAVQHLKPYLGKGIPEMDVPPLDPFIVPTIGFSTGNGTSFELDFEATDVIAYGANDFDVLDAKADFDNGKYMLTLEFKSMNITGHYKVNGRVMVFQLDASGPFEVYLTNVVVMSNMQGEYYKKKGKDHIKYSDEGMDLSVKVGKQAFHFDNLFEGNKELTERTNVIFNENADALAEELYPLTNQLIGPLLLHTMNRVNDLFSLDELFPRD